MTFRLEPLDDAHDLEPFDCGSAALNEWLKRHASHARGQGTRTYVLLDEKSGSVVGYFAIAPHMLARDEAPPKIGRGAPRQIPAILIAKLAIDRAAQGRGLGSELLVRSLATIVEAAGGAGGKVIVVDAIHEHAASFYAHHDFESLPHDRMRLAMKISTAVKALGIPWP